MSVEAAPYARRWQALIVLSVSLLVVTIGNTVVNVALPTIQEDLGASASELQWIVDGYLLLFAGLLLAAGSLGDRFGRRRALVAGLVVFGVGSALAALASSPDELIAARALSGIGAAGIMPVTLSTLTAIFPPEERAKAIAAWAGVSGLGIAAGPVAGGWMIEHAGWNAIFLMNIPAVVVCLAGVFALVPETRHPGKPRLDVVGAALSVAGLTSLVWALIEAPESGWTDLAILAAFASSLVIAAVFVWWERRVAQPMLEIGVFRNRRFSAASLSISFIYFALMGSMYFLTTYLQTVLGYSALGTGVRMVPIAVGMIVASRLSVALVERLGAKIVVACGQGVIVCALAMLAILDASSGDLQIAAAMFTMGCGIGLAMPPATEAIMGALPKARAGVGSAMNDVVREVAGTLGVAVLGSVLASTYASGMEGAVGGLSAEDAAAAGDSVGAAHAVGGDALVAAADAAFVDAMSTAAVIAAVVAAVGALIAARWLPARARTGDSRPEPARLKGTVPLPAAD